MYVINRSYTCMYIYICNYKSWSFFGIHKQLGMIHGRVWKWRMNSLFMAVSVRNIVINHQILGGVYPESSPAGSRSGSHDPELSSLRTVSTAPGGWDLGFWWKFERFIIGFINIHQLSTATVSSGLKRHQFRQARRRSWCRTASAAGGAVMWDGLELSSWPDIKMGRIQISSDILTYTLYNYIYIYVIIYIYHIHVHNIYIYIYLNTYIYTEI